ncbi:MAG: hypothetical protein M1820_006625 [Bogoriella megaspora]|nr:MAG: hypothetical protein M1820_006625 [Bogoriella megaspora]
MGKATKVNHFAVPDKSRVQVAYAAGQLRQGSRSHHCNVCKVAPGQRCFDQGHIDLCEVCFCRFNVATDGGCGEHPYHNDYNLDSKWRLNYDNVPDEAVSEYLDEWAARRNFDPTKGKRITRINADRQVVTVQEDRTGDVLLLLSEGSTPLQHKKFKQPDPMKSIHQPDWEKDRRKQKIQDNETKQRIQTEKQKATVSAKPGFVDTYARKAATFGIGLKRKGKKKNKESERN